MVTITDGEELATRILGRYVGGSSPFKLFSTTPDLTVTFHSDPAGLVFGKGEGFIINYMGENWEFGRETIKKFQVLCILQTEMLIMHHRDKTTITEE